MFAGLADDRVDVGEVTLRVRHAGDAAAPAVLLIHGHPRTGATWHRVAPRLVDAGYAVVCPDMRGYGQSTKADVRPDHAQQSKRTVASDFARLMTALGHERFSAVGHDRGCYVALRLALDYPERVQTLTVMDGIPISEALDRCDARFATQWYHWFFFAQPGHPERLINADPAAFYRGDPDAMGPENHVEWLAAVNDPDTVRAMLEDYRAGLGVDRADEDDDRAHGRRVGCPTMFLWSTRDDMEDLYGDPLAIWRRWAPDLRGQPIESGHHMAEDNPEDLARALIGFLGSTVRA
jgi:haloacetate dehalogenase